MQSERNSFCPDVVLERLLVIQGENQHSRPKENENISVFI